MRANVVYAADTEEAKHHADIKTVELAVSALPSIKRPPLGAQNAPDFDSSSFKDKEYAAQLEEWLGLVSLHSPRLSSSDSVDAYLSRYQVPSLTGLPDDSNDSSTEELVTLRYHGFLHFTIMTELIMAVRKASKRGWAALVANDFTGSSFNTILLPHDSYLEWFCPRKP